MKANLMIGDRITRIDDYSITTWDSTQSLITKIQWPAWTQVTLTIQRGENVLTKAITRQKIIINPITLKKINSDTILIDISSFQVGIYDIFVANIPQIIGYNTIIIDLRNNWWWSLDDTRAILDHIVPKYSPIYNVIQDTTTTAFLSKWSSTASSLQDKKIIFVTNNYSASASEILAGVTREYNSNSHIIGTQSFWKWSIQTIRTYTDGSILKLTTAQRSLGKSRKSIQGIGLTPDVVVIDDPLTIQDEILEYIIKNI
jgi:carboxyl-terminal processing protease